MRIFYTLIATSILLYSCTTKPVKVYVDKSYDDSTTHTIVFDGKDSFKIADTAIDVQLTPGKHQFVIDKEAPRSFEVGANGGMLNPDNKEYVAFDVVYEETSSTSGGGKGLNDLIGRTRLSAVILIDSFVVMPSKGVMHSDSSLRKILPTLLAAKNGNYLGFGNEVKQYDTDQSITGMKKFGKDKLFIDEFWDYGPGEKIPETVEIKTSKYSIGAASTTKSAVLPAKSFLMYAMLSGEEYKVKSLAKIRAGEYDANDKEQEMEKEKENEDELKTEQTSEPADSESGSTKKTENAPKKKKLEF